MLSRSRSLGGYSSRRLCLSFLASLTSVLGMESALAQRDLTEIPTPDPVAELAAMHIAEGFEVNLFAADPQLAKPIHMNWDAQGRLWVASSKNYPQLRPGATPSDELIVLEDTSGDGVADKRTVFADDLMIPTGVLPGDGGVYVANSTQLIHLSDTDADGRADRRRTVLSGFGTEDTHHLLHTLRWRPDGRIAMNQSIYIHSHIETPYGLRHLDGGGIWHFDPHTSELEVFCKGFVNPWGHVVDPFGQSLVTDGAYFEGINYAFPGAVFVTSPGATRWLSGLNPGSPKHCGLELISGSAMPSDAQGLLVTNDFRGHRVCLFRIERHGAGYRSVQLPELIRSDHIAFRPIDVKMGPDGAIYVADWYNPIIQHGEVDFRDPRRDTEHGRIWRISAKGHPRTSKPNYEELSEQELATLLNDSALWVRQFARLELARRESKQVDEAIGALATDDGSAALQPMWLQLSQHRVEPQLLGRLRQHADPRVRAAALRVIGEQRDDLPGAESWLSEGSTDQDDQVVLEAVCGLNRIGTMSAMQSVLGVAGRPNQDQFLRFAVWTALRENEPTWLAALENGTLRLNDFSALEALADAATTPAVSRLLLQQVRSQAKEKRPRTVLLIATRADADGLGELAQWICAPETGQDAAAAELLSTVVTQTQARKINPKAAGDWLPETITRLGPVTSKNQDFAISLLGAAAQWKTTGAVEVVDRWLVAATESNNRALAMAAIDSLSAMGARAGRQRVRELAGDANLDLMLRGHAVAALSSFDAGAGAQQLVGILKNPVPSELPSNITRTINSLMNRKEGPAVLQKAVSSTEPDTWVPDRARTLLAAVRGSQQSSESLVAAIMRATGLGDAGWKFSTEFANHIIALSQKQGDPVRGESIYRQAQLQCIRCHAIGPSGIAIGPNLVSLGGSSTPDYILESLIDPSAKVKEGFQTLNVLLETDEIVSGLQKSRTDDEIQMLLADGSHRVIATDSIESIREGQSLMPAGLLDQLSERELVDLLAFMSRLGRSPEYTVDTRPWVRNWMALQWSAAAHRRLNRTSMDTAATDDPALNWVYLASGVSGETPLGEASTFQPHRETPKTVFLRFDIDCTEAGGVQLKFTQPGSAISYWIDSRPRPTPAADEVIHLDRGMHRVVLGIRLEQTDGFLGCEVVPSPTGGAVFELPMPGSSSLK